MSRTKEELVIRDLSPPRRTTSKKTFVSVEFGIDAELAEKEAHTLLVQIYSDLAYPSTFDALNIHTNVRMQCLTATTKENAPPNGRQLKLTFALQDDDTSDGILVEKLIHQRLKDAIGIALIHTLDDFTDLPHGGYSIIVENKVPVFIT